MVRWICPECGREWAHHERCCWVCAQDAPPLGELCALALPAVRNGADGVVAYGGLPSVKQYSPTPVVGTHILEIDREEWSMFAALSLAPVSEPEPAAVAVEEVEPPPPPMVEVVAEPEPEPEPMATAEPAMEPGPSDEVVTALVPDDSPPRIIPGWLISLVLMVALIAGLALLVYLLFHAHFFTAGDRQVLL